MPRAAKGPPEVRVIGIAGMPEVAPGNDLAALILDALAAQGTTLQDGDVLVVTQKIVSKAEGRLAELATVEPSELAKQFARRWRKDARQVELVLREARRVVRMDRGVVIVETHHGFVCANAGVDASNTGRPGFVTLLPEDPDASAERIRAEVQQRTGAKVPVIIADSFGRPWREGIDQVALGVAGLLPLRDYTGERDPDGYELRVTQVALADELAAAAELVMGKLDRVPAAIVRGYAAPSGAGSGRQLLRDAAKDLFR
ncbi:MAG: coenzyme F420-0:L-glutamate ligase [Dehalococcoidia bacterium]|jgi:coenzyme F420-0:L-glutamate ligase/coenzyme F420-1:gamma-L-glutamate ligase